MKTLRRRRKENKTNYKKRIKLLKSKSPRLVIRRTNRYFIAQYITSKEAADKVEIGITSKMLLKYGWPEELHGSLKSLPAAYFLGLLIGKKIQEEGLKIPITDFGLYRALHKSRLYAFVKGLVDSGLKVKHRDKTFPEEKKLKGEKIPFQEIKTNINKIGNGKKK